MNDELDLPCAACETRDCVDGKDCIGAAEEHLALYEDERIAALARAASAIEARHYCKEPRIREIMLFAKECEFRKLGLAFCVGLAAEGQIVAEILSREFEVVSVCCEVCGIDKAELGLEQIRPEDPRETMCNPAGQAAVLNEAGAELNVLCGLCVGHDAIFTMCSQAPVTTLIAKDRVLAHNSAGAIYSRYIRRTLRPED
ncbi:MAG: DUF1847 domain-containing protein [Phycisphaerales bacterium]|nr:MAG: DUF1847 domain-containing protein [Phycisphaerales bacterium]